MKKLISTSLILLSLLSISCSKDDDSPNGNSVKMDGDSFQIVGASILGVSMGEDGHTAITLTNGNQTQAKTLTIDVESFTIETIEGDYSYPVTEETKLLDDWLTNYSIITGSTSIVSSNLKSGNVSIIHNSGSNYTLDIDLIMVDGITFKGSYSGDFTVMFMNQ